MREQEKKRTKENSKKEVRKLDFIKMNLIDSVLV